MERHLNAECDRLATQVGAMRSSFSWRMTAPLRALKALLRRS
jgi:hypothetical protein